MDSEAPPGEYIGIASARSVSMHSIDGLPQQDLGENAVRFVVILQYLGKVAILFEYVY
jgi:hypothetical protein